MAGDRKWTLISIILFAGLNMIFFAISPIIESALRIQLQIMQIFMMLLIVVTSLVGAIEIAKGRLQIKPKI